jgi:chromosome segregation ATPase
MDPVSLVVILAGLGASGAVELIKERLRDRGKSSEADFETLARQLDSEAEPIRQADVELQRERQILEEVRKTIETLPEGGDDRVANEVRRASAQVGRVADEHEGFAERHDEVAAELARLRSEVASLGAQGTRSFWMGVAWNAGFFAAGVGASALVG